MLVIVMIVKLSAEQTVIQRSEFQNLRNVGVILQPVRSIALVEEIWTHTFGINLTMLNGLYVVQPPLCTSLPTSEAVATCSRFLPLLQVLQRMDRKAVKKLNTTVNHVNELLHNTVSTNPDRRKRAWIPFVSEILHTAFGLATDRSVAAVTALLNDLRRNTTDAMSTMVIHTQKLSSFMQIENKRFDKFEALIQTQQNTFLSFLESYKNEFHDTQAAQLLIANALQRMLNFNLNMDAINSFHQALILATHGMLTPELIPVADLKETFRQLKQSRHNIHNPSFMLRLRPEDVYGSHDFHIWIRDNYLYITVQFPFSPVAHALDLYKIVRVPFPHPTQPQHYSRVTNLPWGIAYSDQEELFITLEEMPQVPDTNLFYLQQSPHVLHNKSHETCLSAIITKDTHKILSSCQFELQPNVMEPQIIQVDIDSLLLIHVPSYTLDCKDGPKTYVPAPIVEVKIPCSCRLRSNFGNYAGRTKLCDRQTLFLPTYIFPINLQILGAYFNKDQLSTLSATLAFDQPLDSIVPNITVLIHQFADTMSSAKQDSMKLQEVANSTQRDSLIFRSATDRLLFALTDAKIPFQSPALSATSWQTLLLIPTSILTVFLSFLVYVMFGKIRTVTMAVNVMNHLPISTSSHVPRVPLTYIAPTNLPKSTFTLPFQIDYTLPALDMVLLTILVTIIIVFGIIWYRYTHRVHDTFQVLIEIGNPRQRALTKLLTLPHNPHHYEQLITAPVELISVTGWLLPRLKIQWPGVAISNRLTLVKYPLPQNVPLSWYTAYKLFQILQTPYYLVLFNMTADKCLASIKIPRPLSQVTPPISSTIYPSLAPYNVYTVPHASATASSTSDTA